MLEKAKEKQSAENDSRVFDEGTNRGVVICLFRDLTLRVSLAKANVMPNSQGSIANEFQLRSITAPKISIVLAFTL